MSTTFKPRAGYQNAQVDGVVFWASPDGMAKGRIYDDPEEAVKYLRRAGGGAVYAGAPSYCAAWQRRGRSQEHPACIVGRKGDAGAGFHEDVFANGWRYF